MKHFLYFLFFSLSVSNGAFCYELELVLDHSCRPANSAFAKVEVVDCRSIPYMNFSENNAGNTAIDMNYKGSITDSIAQFFLPANTLSGTNSELKVFLYNLYLIENDKDINTESLRISMRFFYNAAPGEFVELSGIDTIYSITALNANILLLNSVSAHLCEIASSMASLAPMPGAMSYSAGEIEHLDSLEKMKLPIYNTEKINAGIYKTYKEFRQNNPIKEEVYVDTTERGTVVANIITPKGKKWIRQKDSVYIISNGVLATIHIDERFYLLRKEGPDYCFYLNETDYTNSNKAAMLFGLAGLLVASAAEIDDVYTGRYKIDYYTGNPVLISMTKNTRKDRKKKN